MSLRHRREYAADLPRGLPGSSCHTAPEVPRPHTRPGAHRFRPRSTRFELAPHQGTVTRRFLAYSSPSRLPDPHHLAVLARPGVVRAAPTLPGTTRIRLPPAPPPCCDRAGGEGLPPPLEPQRLTAHAHAPAHVRDDHARRRRQLARRPDRGAPRRPSDNDALRPRPQEPRPPRQLHPRRLHGLGNVDNLDQLRLCR